jgi:hypothetical protein
MACTGPTPLEEERAENYARQQALFKSHATPLLCEACQEMEKHDMMRWRSAALNSFWTQHKKDDAARLAKEIANHTEATERNAAIAKLTPHERKLLGL